jgi:hypothetical protein
MKFKYILNGLFGAAVLFAGVMAYLFYSDREAAISDKPAKPVVREAARTVSGKAGKLVVFYTGDLIGNLGPCT